MMADGCATQRRHVHSAAEADGEAIRRLFFFRKRKFIEVR
jgi:hypothetical protein